MTKDEIINHLMIAINKEIDYWLLESNIILRELEYGEVNYNKIVARFVNLRQKVLDTVTELPEVDRDNDVLSN